MLKSQLINILADKSPHLPKKTIEHIVSTILGTIGDALSQEDRVELRGFGSFFVREHKKRIGRNPRTGESITIAKKHVPAFRMSKKLYEKLNNAFFHTT